MANDVTWVVFGDDWGSHPSTTQHLILNMPPNHRVIWVDSIGMRSPKFNVVDFRRLISKAASLFERQCDESARLYQGSVGQITRVRPRVLPWHQYEFARHFNKRWFARSIGPDLKRCSDNMVCLLTANPVVAYYHDVFPVDKTVYLRLDDYGEYPGCDPELVKDAEEQMFAKAEVIIATARQLLPDGPLASKSHYLPQGVQVDAFRTVPVCPPRKPVMGFFGSIAEWLDFPLIESVASQAVDWNLEFIGNPDCVPASLREHENISILEPVPFSSLAEHISHWAAAWIPFKINELTVSVNPLKLREYLAAGLPTLSTPLPEVTELGDLVFVSADPDQIVTWMRRILEEDSVEQRQYRRASADQHSWAVRADRLLELAGIPETRR